MSDTHSISELAATFVKTAQRQGFKLVTAESCTAGALATLIADTPGAGDVLVGGFVTYAKSCKEALLGVPRNLIDLHTAVSAEVATAMSQGALERCEPANLAIAITCVGGPEPDGEGNPVGLTFLSAGTRNEPHRVCEARIEQRTSGRVRGEVLSTALQLLLNCIEERGSHG